MLLKTHLAISLLISLFFFPSMSLNVIFLLVVLFATMLPDIDSANSHINHKIGPINHIFNLLTKHRGALHSFTLCFFFSILIFFMSRNLVLPFFLGYASHILSDGLTLEGIKPFWPIKQSVHGVIKTSGLLEKIIFYSAGIFDIFLFVSLLK